MPTFKVTDPNTGVSFNLTGDSPPTEAELEEIFAQQAALLPAQPEESAAPTTTIGQDILGGIESAGVIASNIIAEPLAGLAGIGAAIVPGGQTGAEAVESTRQRLAIQPETAAAESQLQAVGETLAPIAEGLGAVEDTLGQAVLDATGSPELAAIAHTLPTAALEALGVGAFIKAPKAAATAGRGLEVAGQAVEGVIENIPQRQAALTKKGRARQSLASLIEERAADQRTVGFDVQARPKPTTSTGKILEKFRGAGPDVVKSPLENVAETQGFNRGVIATIKDSSPATKRGMLKMTQIMETAKNRALEGVKTRPGSVVGESLMKRINTITTANRQAGTAINKAAENLKGQSVDLSDAVLGFDDALSNLGVSLVPDGKGGFKPDFEFSQLSPGDRGPLKEVIRQMNIRSVDGGLDAFSAHKMKRAIDNNVTFGKSKGISGDAEGALKSFRTAIDDALDTNFPEYNAANTQYSETIRALDAFQDVAGRKLDLSSPRASEATGQVMRRMLSNADSRVRLMDAVDEIENVASKYKNSKTSIDGTLLIEEAGAKSKAAFDDDLAALTLYADELDARFKPAARGSLENLVGRSTERALKTAVSPTSVADVATQVIGKSVESLKGITDQTAFKAIRDLLKSTN